MSSKAGKNSVTCVLGTEKFLRPIFSYYTMPASWDAEKTLREGIEHAFSFTMLRDQFYGGWAHCYKPKGDNRYHLQLTSPNPDDDVTGYAQLVPKFVKTLAKAEKAISRALKSQTEEMREANLRFLPPFGLSLLRTTGVLLLHYPPDETITYTNYLHSRTTKRWESLLIANGNPGAANPLLMAITDVYPVTANGDSAGSKLVDKLCNPIGKPLDDYAYDLLTLLVRPKKKARSKVTQPLVALGGAVRDWLVNNDTLRGQIEPQVGFPLRDKNKDGTWRKKEDGTWKASPKFKPLLQFNLKLQARKDVTTPVLLMDHPCKYYRGNSEQNVPAGKLTAKKKAQLASMRAKQATTDLIGTRWYVNMAAHPEADPQEVLKEAKSYWTGKSQKAELARAIRDQETEFQHIADVNPTQ